MIRADINTNISVSAIIPYIMLPSTIVISHIFALINFKNSSAYIVYIFEMFLYAYTRQQKL
jgi:hypothetical protein